MFASNDHNLEIKRKQTTPVNEWYFYPNKQAPVEMTPTAPVKTSATNIPSYYVENLSIFKKPMPNELKYVRGYISLNKASQMLGTQNSVLMRLAKEGKLVIHDNGITGNGRRYRISSYYLRLMFKINQRGKA